MQKNRIAPLRHERGINQKELGQELGVAQTTVSAWETGKTEPDSAALNKMAQLFHVSIGYLMGYEAESLTRGLSQAEHDALVEKALAAQRQQELEKAIEQLETTASGEADEEGLAEYFRRHEMDEWKKAGAPDTFQGFLVSRLVDAQPTARREWLYETVQQLLKVPEA